MHLETAIIHVQPGREEEFISILPQAIEVVRRAEGFVDLTIHRGVEKPSDILLTIHWRTLEDHTEKFRGGPLFPEWRALIGPFFAEPPTVEHWEVRS